MRHTDVVIAGGGLAGSLAAAMLGRAGIDAVMVAPHAVYPADFRCEKLDGVQMATLKKTGIVDAVLRNSTHDRHSWVARFGRIVEKRPGDQQGVMYDTLVNTVRSQIPVRTEVINAKVTDIRTGPERQTVVLSNGGEISARLVVLANGLNPGFVKKLGMERQVISAGHSISIGFDVKPADGTAFPFPALTYYNERATDGMGYITLFPIGTTMRANLFGYRDLHDPWLKQFRDAPQETLYAMWPGLKKLMGDFTVTDFIKIRPVDLYVTKGHMQAGIVLVGDAFSTSCPAAGTGARKVLVDVERLCNVHIPQWLATPGMGETKIAAFYADEAKAANDTYCKMKAFQLRSFCTDTSLPWVAKRWAKFALHAAKGALRSVTAPVPSSYNGVEDDVQEEARTWVRSTSAQG
jgi:2-polyprenyl-6-methoxyphenol hydroxylase-like FAD-dependent oxidoreductase